MKNFLFAGLANNARHLARWLVILLGLSVSVSANGGEMQLIVITNPVPTAGAAFGYSVTMVGSNYFVVGAPFHDTNAVDSGSVYLYQINPSGTNITLVASIPNPAPGVSNLFGYSVSGIGDTRFVVGAPNNDLGATNSGGVYVFDLSGQLLNSITNPVPAANAQFGISVAGVGPGTYFVVGVPGDDFDGNDAGRAWRFTAAGEESGNIRIPAAQNTAGEHFGFAVAAIGTNLIAIGSPDRVNSGANLGRIYISTLGRSPHATLQNPSGGGRDDFGKYISGLGSDHLVIGAPKFNGAQGRVLVANAAGAFVRTNLPPASPPSSPSGTNFGSAVAGTALGNYYSGAPWSPQASTNAGLAFQYDLANAAFAAPFTNAAPVSNDFFGFSITANTNGFLVGAPAYQAGVAPTRPGRVFFFRVPEYTLCDEIKPPPGPAGYTLNSVDPRGVGIYDSGRVLPTNAGKFTIQWIYTNLAAPPAEILSDVIIKPFPVTNVVLSGEIRPPLCADVTLKPILSHVRRAYWHGFTNKLYATEPGPLTVTWTRSGNRLAQFSVDVIVTGWPTNESLYQVHVANTPAVDLDAGGFPFSQLMYQEPGTNATITPTLTNRLFSATGRGRSLLLLAATPLDPTAQGPVKFQFVQTIQWNDSPYYRTNLANIGTPIVHPGHNPLCGSPYAFDYPNRRYRYCMDPGYYNPTNRTGPIIPVNRPAAGLIDNDLLLVHYQFGTTLVNPTLPQPFLELGSGSNCWPYLPIRHQSTWPSSPEKTVVIASGKGTGPLTLNKWSIYRQENVNRPGYNPNEEHAIALPDQGDPSALKVNPEKIMLLEGESSTVELRLIGEPAKVPAAPVTISFQPARSSDPDIAVSIPGSTNPVPELVVTNDLTWVAPRVVTFSTVTRSNNVGSNTIFTVRATGGVVAQSDFEVLKVTTNTLSLVISKLAFSIDETKTNGFTVRLSRQPGTAVSLTVTRNSTNEDPSLVLQSGQIYTFTTNNWNDPHLVVIEANADADSGNGKAVFRVRTTGEFSSTNLVTVTSIDKDDPDLAVFPLRDDLGDELGSLAVTSSEPYVLIKYEESSDNWRIKVYRVVAEDDDNHFQKGTTAGQLLQPPYPLTIYPPVPCVHAAVSGPFWQDHKNSFWAKAAAFDALGNRATTNIVMRYFYKPLVNPTNGFDPPTGGSSYAGTECLPWLERRARIKNPNHPVNTPINFTQVVFWPALIPKLHIGETLLKPKFGLPNIYDQCSVDILYEQRPNLVRLIDAIAPRTVSLAAADFPLPPNVITEQAAGGAEVFMQVPLSLRKRLRYYRAQGRLEFNGVYDTSGTGEPLLLLNVLSAQDRDILIALSPSSLAYVNAIQQLYSVTQERLLGSTALGRGGALSAGEAQNTGFVTLAFQNGSSCNALPVSLEILEVSCPRYRGEIKIIYPDCPFEEKLTLRHSGDFGGRPENYYFEWFIKYDGATDWTPYLSRTNLEEITLQQPGLLTVGDNQFRCRYRREPASLICGTNDWSDWTPDQLAEGWIKRVVRGINPFDQVSTNFHGVGVNTTVSMLSRAGSRWQGNIALNCMSGNEFGLLEAYETVLRRGIDLSIGAGLNYDGANKALRLAAGRINDLYMLLGNEAYGDAQDPTIAAGVGGEYTVAKTSIHCFQGPTASLLDEELMLLRGYDDANRARLDEHPFYNRLRPNFSLDLNGQTAYVLNYVADSTNGINFEAAKNLYPQGHGDAWGHYLTAIKSYYRLLLNTNYDSKPEIEEVIIGSSKVQVGFQHERKFAKAAAAKARTGAEIINLSYRSSYVEDPDGQWQGYTDNNTNRAWGVSEWGSRAGQGALFDWIMANALLPDRDLINSAERKVDRTTVSELREVAADYQQIQAEVDTGDAGLNPLGLAKNVVPFGISPTELDMGKTHFQQIYQRTITAMNNAIAVFNYANDYSQHLRRQSDEVQKFKNTIIDREADFNNRLIEIFGYPYPDDIEGRGPGPSAYPPNYDGPDLVHFNYVEISQLEGVASPTTQTLTNNLRFLNVAPNGALIDTVRPVVFNLSTDGLTLVKPASWSAPRRAPGDIQRALSELIQARVGLEEGLANYDNLIAQIEDQASLLQAQYFLNTEEIVILNAGNQTQQSLNQAIKHSRDTQAGLRAGAQFAVLIANAVAEFLPKIVGLANDVTSGPRGAIRFAGAITSQILSTSADIEALSELDHQQAKEAAQAANQLELRVLGQTLPTLQQIAQLKQLVRQEAPLRYSLFNLREKMLQSASGYLSVLARGQRLHDDRTRFRQQTARDVQDYRYKDMAFRIFRNDALQKYRAQFDLAARYVYLAAKAYDYETSLLQSDTSAGARFLQEIVRKRSIGVIQDGRPQPGPLVGDPGLAAALYSLDRAYAAFEQNLKVEDAAPRPDFFSLRSGFFRILPTGFSTGDTRWQETLRHHRVSNIWDIAAFRKYCNELRPEVPHEPGIVIEFPSAIFGDENFFGLPAGAGDKGYNAGFYATRVRSVGIFFENYDSAQSSPGGLRADPRAYLVPVGEDVFRIRLPDSHTFEYRNWQVIDQKIPILDAFDATSVGGFGRGWIPVNSLNINLEVLGELRRLTPIDVSYASVNMIGNSGLVGRSVWNTRWLLIIPGVALLGTPDMQDEALTRFIEGGMVGGQRTGLGVTDILLYFQTYHY